MTSKKEDVGPIKPEEDYTHPTGLINHPALKNDEATKQYLRDTCPDCAWDEKHGIKPSKR